MSNRPVRFYQYEFALDYDKTGELFSTQLDNIFKAIKDKGLKVHDWEIEKDGKQNIIIRCYAEISKEEYVEELCKRLEWS